MPRTISLCCHSWEEIGRRNPIGKNMGKHSLHCHCCPTKGIPIQLDKFHNTIENPCIWRRTANCQCNSWACICIVRLLVESKKQCCKLQSRNLRRDFWFSSSICCSSRRTLFPFGIISEKLLTVAVLYLHPFNYQPRCSDWFRKHENQRMSAVVPGRTVRFLATLFKMMFSCINSPLKFM
jgi:hypothetical protein